MAEIKSLDSIKKEDSISHSADLIESDDIESKSIESKNTIFSKNIINEKKEEKNTKFIRFLGVFALFAFFAILVDQAFKWSIIFVGYKNNGEVLLHGDFISLVLVYNKGVAFSLFAFLDEALKYIQITIMCGILGFLLFAYRDFFKEHCAALGLVLGAGASNTFDRFVHSGVVDYIFWHYGFEFAIFNLADVLIDLGIAWIILRLFLKFKKESKAREIVQKDSI